MLDEAIDLAKTVLNSNQNSILLVLQPMVGGNSPQVAVTKNRRTLEDKLMAKLGLQDLRLPCFGFKSMLQLLFRFSCSSS